MGDLARAFDEALQVQGFHCPLCGMQHEQCRVEFEHLGRMAKEFDITGMCPWCQLGTFISYDDPAQCKYWEEVAEGVRILEGDYSQKMRKVLKAWSQEARFQSDDQDIWEQMFWVATLAMDMARNDLIDAKVGEMAKIAWKSADTVLSAMD